MPRPCSVLLPVFITKISLHMQNVQAAVPEGFVPEVILLLLILLLVVTV